MIESTAQIRITEAELAEDLHGVVDKVQQGVEILVEQDDRPVAVIRSPLPKGRLLSQCIALAEARGSAATLDEGFMMDVEEGSGRRSQPWNPPTLCAITVAELAHGIYRADSSERRARRRVFLDDLKTTLRV
jgi:antitoxin (DNA-binding transcriptional repressor) of toxin-antitoxin stability system